MQSPPAEQVHQPDAPTRRDILHRRGAQVMRTTLYGRHGGRELAHDVACGDCHFLVKTSVVPRSQPIVQVVSAAERAAARQGDFGWVHDYDALSCYRGVWDEGRGSPPDQRGDQLSRPRVPRGCFFLRHTSGMSLDAALDLSARDTAAVEARRSRRPVWVGAAIAIVTAVLAYVAIADTRNWWPF